MKLDDFKDFFEELHSTDNTRIKPFPWQNQLMEHVVNNGWPNAIDLPTSAGKTAILDIALFHLALEADLPPIKRRAPIRIFFVVDRRIVVDEAFFRSCRIRSKLNKALLDEDGILFEVAKQLTKISSESEECPNPLEVIRLRGGLPLERAFIRNPLQPSIVLSTVDQIGSRLLFRGYGVSQFMRPIHAALVGLDSIIILDEAHLSQPFRDTLSWVKRYQSENWAEKIICRPVSIVQMTATLPEKRENVFSPLDDNDDWNWRHEALGPRLTCSKSVDLISIEGDVNDIEGSRKKTVEKLTEEAVSIMKRTRQFCKNPVVGVIVNRVLTARQVFERLHSEEDADAILLTGRTRPFDRDELLREYLPRIKAGRTDDANLRPLYVVATQTIEVGADIDFDAIVTEVAALDALRQRFGRLNRLGKRSQASATAVYVDFGRGNVDPVYGTALAETWKWMSKTAKKARGQKCKSIDFGIWAMKSVLPSGDDLAKMLTPRKTAPVLMPSHMDMLVQTCPTPAVEPEVALYLHGSDTQPEDVQIVWRSDLPETLGTNEDFAAISIVSVIPPSQLETLSIPVSGAKSILSNSWKEDISISDVEGGIDEAVTERGNVRYAVQWIGAEDSKVIRRSSDIRPGSILVIPSSYGGLDNFGWHPFWDQPVRDVGDEAAFVQHGKQFVRIHENLIPQWFEDPDSESVNQIRTELRGVLNRFIDGEDLSELCDEFLENLVMLTDARPEIRDKFIKLKSNCIETVYPDVATPKGITLHEARNTSQAFTDDNDASSLTDEVILEDHCKGVGELANIFAVTCGLSDELIRDLSIAGKLHDLGKADPRFQTWLWDGDKMAMIKANKILAKSGRLNIFDRDSIRMAREMADYPKGGRHECYSVGIVEQNEYLLDDSVDKDLLLYLIGASHGRGRPLIPSLEDSGFSVKFEFEGRWLNFSGKHNLDQLDSGWSERFWELNRRYGYWGLAYLETLVRLADHRRSEQGE
jgi:CRISPR-associated endonuclease/helicase Cas3